MTTEEVESINISANTENHKRVWEIDALRGFLILLVALDHFLWDVAFMFSFNTPFGMSLKEFARNWHYGIGVCGEVRSVIHDPCVLLFVFISGLSSSLSRNNAKRAVKMAGFAVGFSLVTYLAQELGFGNILVSFNVIHVIALCVFVWALLDWLFSLLKNKHAKTVYVFGVLILALACIICGHYFAKYSITERLSYPQSILVQNTSLGIFSPGDRLFLLPSLGWFLLGGCFSKLLYKDRKTLFPTVNERVALPLTFCGRYCIWIYFGSQVAFVGLLTLLCDVMGML